MKIKKQKLEAILNLLTDKTWLKLKDNPKYFTNEDERFGALVLLGYLFKEVYKIARKI